MSDGMELLRQTCREWGLDETVADHLWDWFTDPNSPTYGDVGATIQALRIHPSWLEGPPWKGAS